MRILIVSHEYPPIGGGGANACMNLAREYSRKGHKVDIVTVWYLGEDDVTRSENISIYRVRSKRKYLEHCGFVEMLDYLLKSWRIVKKLANCEKYDICQVFFGIPSGPIGWQLKRKYGIPYVIRFGGGDIPGFQDRFSQVYRIIAPAIKQIWKEADALVANSSGLKEMAEAFYNKKEILIIPNGADVRASDQNYGRISDNGCKDSNIIKLLFVSRLIERKGLQDIIPQIKEVKEQCEYRDIQLCFEVIGDGPYRSVLEEMTQNEGLSGTIVFYGQKKKDELPYFYQNADIFVFPSRKEGMPNVVLEAMSYGLPIVMTPCQGSDELIDENGIVSKSNKFGENIIKLILDNEARCKYGKKSLRMISERYSWQNTCEKYLDLFYSIITHI